MPDDRDVCEPRPGDGPGMRKLRAFVAELRAERAMRESSPLSCAECGRGDDGRRGWTLRLDVDDELVAFCPDCDKREFGDA